MKVCIINSSGQYVRMFEDRGWEVVKHIFDADLVQFTGGSDVSPAYYGEDLHPETYPNIIRDEYEAEVFKACKAIGKPMAGICRGAQFLHVMNGGNLWQHVLGHAIYGTHRAIDTMTGNVIPVTSTHHQMMRQSDTGFCVMVGAEEVKHLKQHVCHTGEVEAMSCEVDVEAYYHADSKCFCYQPHPEFEEGQCREYYFLKLKEFFGLE